VGERTFGEGSVQKTIDLPDGAALMLTVAKYEAPDGHKIQDEAVMPNVQVAQSSDENLDLTPQTNKEDQPLDKALAILKEKSS
jgi:carboxyl-terminal processing protease